MPITGGQVTFEQSRKLAEYENRKVAIVFSVTDEQGAEEQCKYALDVARSMTLHALGLATAGSVVETVSNTPEKKGPGRPKKAPATPPATTAATAGVAAVAAAVEDATAVTDVAPQIRTNGEDRKDPSQVDDSIFTAAEEVATVSDAELLSAVTRKNAALQIAIGPAAPPKIRALIGKYAKQARDIPQEKRSSFLNELAALAA